MDARLHLPRARRLLWAVPLLALAGGCETAGKRAQTAGSVTVDAESKSEMWQAVATQSDEDRIQRLGLAWQEALAEAGTRYESAIAEEGALLEPLAALPRPAPTPGSYNCRLVRMGKTDSKSPAFERYKPFFCYVLVDDDGVLTIVKQTGSERPAGRLWEDDRENRMIFLGSMALGDEEEPLAYGEDPERDMAGVFERFAPFRWRLVIPYPRSGAKLDVFELTPVANQPE